jgi:nucleotide-binding universal stress UspA family protein
MFRSILVPLDGSGFAEQAVPLAQEIARRSSASLTLARVHLTVTPGFAQGVQFYDDNLDNTVRDQDLAYVQEVARRLAAKEMPVRGVLLEGPVSEGICEQAQSAHADLVVLSTHGRGPLARFWLGSVADELIRKLPMPTLAMHPREEAAPRAAVFRHILIPLDGSLLAEEILEPATALGTLGDAEYTLMRCIAPTIIGGATFPDMGGMLVDDRLLRRLEEAHAEASREAEIYLQRLAERLRERGLRVRTRVLDSEQPALAVLAQARELNADLIALATHGRGGLNRLLLGSVADKVLRGASAPVLLVHPQPTAGEPEQEPELVAARSSK